MKRAALLFSMLFTACSGDDDIASLPKLITLNPHGPSSSIDVRGRIIFPEKTTKPQLVALTYFSMDDPQTEVVRVAPGSGVDYEVPGLYLAGSFGAGVDLNGNGEFDAGEWLGFGGGTVEAPVMLPGEATYVRPSSLEPVVTLDIPLGVLGQCHARVGDACTESIECRYTTCFCPQGGFMRLGGKCEGGVCTSVSVDDCTEFCETSEPLAPTEGPCFSWMDATEK